jgi:hypothetical protein
MKHFFTLEVIRKVRDTDCSDVDVETSCKIYRAVGNETEQVVGSASDPDKTVSIPECPATNIKIGQEIEMNGAALAASPMFPLNDAPRV